MEKPILHMKEWELYTFNGIYSLIGIVAAQPENGKDVCMEPTSPMVRYSLERDNLIYETEDAVYVCPLSCLTTVPYADFFYEDIEELKEQIKEMKNDLDRIIYVLVVNALDEQPDGPEYEFVMRVRELQKRERQERREREEREKERLVEEACKYEDCIYMELMSLTNDKIGYHLEAAAGVMEPKTRWGSTWNNSRVLFFMYPEGGNPCRLDFRYFLHFSKDSMGIKSYSWSKNIKQAVVKNTGERVLTFNGCELQPGETKSFTREAHRQEIVLPEEM